MWWGFVVARDRATEFANRLRPGYAGLPGRLRTFAAAMLIAAAAIGMPSAAWAVSAGCQAVNNGALTSTGPGGTSRRVDYNGAPFAAGDVLNLTFTTSGNNAGEVLNLQLGSQAAQKLGPQNGDTLSLTANGGETFARASIDSGAGTGTGTNTITVTCAAGPAPAVTSVSPNSGVPAGGTSVTITGTGFTGATAVRFGATNATSFTVNSSTSITAVSPAGAGTLDITVTTPADTSATSANDRFTYAAVSSSVSLTSSANPSTLGQSVTFTATVTGASPTGTVTFKDGATTLGTGTVNGSGQATFTTASLAAGSHAITAAYGGDTNNTPGTSPVLTQVVNQAGSSVSLTSSANPSTFGQSVTFTATVTGASPTGTVTFNDGATTLGTGTVNGSGQATFTTSSLAAGSHSITATYGGDINNTPGTSPVLTQVVNQATTTTTLASSKNPSSAGEAVTFTATASSGGTPAGTVTFRDGGTVIGTGTLSGGVATFTTSSLSVGSHAITANYNGDANNAASTSAVLTQSVQVPADSVKLRALQIAVTKMIAQGSGQAITGAVDSAIGEGFAGGGVPFTMSPAGMRFNFAAETERMDEAFAALGYDKIVRKEPTYVRPEKNWLPWLEIRGTGWDVDTTRNGIRTDITGTQVNAVAGLTRKLTQDFLIGAFGGWETFDYTSQQLNGRLKGDGWTVGGYLGWRLTPALRFDATAARSGLSYDGTAGTANASFPGTRWLASLGLTGMHKAGGFAIEPSLKAYGLWERESAYIDTLGTAQTERNFATGRASAGVKVAYPLMWSAGSTMSPYAGLYADYHFSKDDAVASALLLPAEVLHGWSARVTSGVALKLQGGTMLSVGGELGGLGNDFMMWTIKGRASVPF
jgi:hypothetical protein